MTPKKDTPKHRDATVVYPGTSPNLILAYRIFGPGHSSLDALAQQRNSVIKPNPPEEGESWLTAVGMDIGRSLKVGIDEIVAAYEVYKQEIKRMNEADRVHERRKQAQLDGVDPEDLEEEEDDEGDDDSDVSDGEVESSSGSGSGSGGQDNEDGSDKNGSDENGSDENEQDEDDSDEDKDEYKRYLGPGLWLSKEEALARAKTIRATIEEMHPTMQSILDNYNHELPATKHSSQAIEKSVNNFLNIRRYAYHLERLITQHDGKKPESTWKSPERLNDTYGDKVPQTLHIIYELEHRVEYMQKALIVTNRVRSRFFKAPQVAAKRHYMKELVYNLRRFAAMCCEKEGQVNYLRELTAERERWSPETSPEPEEFLPNRSKTDAA